MKRLEKIFSAAEKVLAVYECCGAPSLQESARRLDAVIKGGANIVELGIPFSDPMADGAAVQQASQQAIANGANLAAILDMASKLRSDHAETALIVYGYYNVFLQYGPEKLFSELARIGIDGIFIVDLPFEEYGEVEPFCRKYDIPLLRTISAATSRERAEKLLAAAQGMVYCENSAVADMVKGLTALPLADRSGSAVCTANAVVVAEKALSVPTADLCAWVADLKKNCINK